MNADSGTPSPGATEMPPRSVPEESDIVRPDGSSFRPRAHDYYAQRASQGDSLAAVDHLGFEPYVRAIEDFLTSPFTHPPLTLSIEGDWGSGKSSFMRQLCDRLQAYAKNRNETTPGDSTGTPKRVLTVWFNAWRHEESESLWAAFALALIHGLQNEAGPWGRLLGSARLFTRRFAWRDGRFEPARATAIVFAATAITMGLGATIIALLPHAHQLIGLVSADIRDRKASSAPLLLLNAGGAAASVAILITIGRTAWSLIGTPVSELHRYIKLAAPNYGSRVAFIEQFHTDVRYITDAYAGPDGRVVVFIDDLDRCAAQEIAELMRAINLMIGDDRRMIFVVGMDRRVVTASLALRWKDVASLLQVSDDVTTGDTPEQLTVDAMTFGAAFLEKFIQVPFALPEPDARVLERYIETLGEPDPPTHESKSPSRTRQFDEVKESDDLKRLTREFAESFDNSPRRLKQFLNVLRLRTYIAMSLGQFDAPDDRTRPTIEQFAKLVALSLQWPGLIDDARRDPDLLDILEGCVLALPDHDISKEAMLSHVTARVSDTALREHVMLWIRSRRLRTLLRCGRVRNADGSWQMAKEYSLWASERHIPEIFGIFRKRSVTP